MVVYFNFEVKYQWWHWKNCTGGASCFGPCQFAFGISCDRAHKHTSSFSYWGSRSFSQGGYPDPWWVVVVVGGGVTSCIWQSTDVCAKWPPFPVLPGIWLVRKVYDWPDFSWLVYERASCSDILVYGHIFSYKEQTHPHDMDKWVHWE